MARCWSWAGQGAGSRLPSAELYDPATNSWAAAGSLVTARYAHTATLLPNGDVLIAGGFSGAGDGSLASVEQYRPATNTWSAAGSLATARADHTAVLLPNSTVMFAGGYDSATVGYLPSAELYVATKHRWFTAGLLGTARYSHTATLLPTGKVLVAGGANGPVLPSAELYDPATNTWSAASPLVIARRYHTATLLPSGKVLVTGGQGVSGTLTSAVLYDPTTNTWSTAGFLATARYQHTATLLPNGKVLVAGGWNGSALPSAELYDPATNSWSAAGSLAAARAQHTATLLQSGKVLVAGGLDASSLASAELYDPASNSWAPAGGSLATGRYQHTATLLPDRKVVFVGGNSGTSGFVITKIYNPANQTWAQMGPLIARRYQHTATLLPNGQVLVTGGDDSIAGIVASAELYDPVRTSWAAAGSLGTARHLHTATLLPDGQVLVAGGYTGSTALASAELFNPGLVPDPSRQPTLGSVNAGVSPGTALLASGSGFWPKLEASGGGTNNSATNLALFQVMRLDNEQTTWLAFDPTVPLSNTAFTSSAAALSGFPFGHVSVRAFVNGIPSEAKQTVYATFPPPDAPTTVTASAGNAQATVSFSAPVNNGGSAITGYTVSSNPAGGVDSNAGSTSLSHLVTGLSNGTAYTFTVTATNAAGGTSVASAASNSVTPKGTQSIGAINFVPPSLAMGSSITASATGGASGNPVTFSSSTPLICSATGSNGSTITGVAVGICSITANQAGNASYLAAAPLAQTIAVTAQPLLVLKPSALEFGNQNVGTPSAAQTVTLTNTDVINLTITSIVPTLPVFSVVNNCAASLAPGSSCTFNVTFTPDATGARVGSITVTTNASGSPHNVTVTGTGVSSAAPVCTLTANPAIVLPGQSSTLLASCSPAATSFSWTGGTCAGVTTSSCMVAPLVATSYSVTGTNSFGSSTASAEVSIREDLVYTPVTPCRIIDTRLPTPNILGPNSGRDFGITFERLFGTGRSGHELRHTDQCQCGCDQCRLHRPKWLGQSAGDSKRGGGTQCSFPELPTGREHRQRWHCPGGRTQQHQWSVHLLRGIPITRCG